MFFICVPFHTSRRSKSLLATLFVTDFHFELRVGTAYFRLNMDFGFLLLLEEEQRAIGNSEKINRHILRDANNPLDLAEDRFRNLFRVSKEVALTLIRSLEVVLKRTRSHGLPVHVIVSTFYLSISII